MKLKFHEDSAHRIRIVSTSSIGETGPRLCSHGLDQIGKWTQGLAIAFQTHKYDHSCGNIVAVYDQWIKYKYQDF